MGIKHLREENGSGLVLTLMVLLVFSVLGVSIGTLTIGSYRLGASNRDATSAYYVAEAGAVAAYEAIQSDVLNAYAEYKTKESFFERVSTIMSSKNGPAGVTFRDQFGSTPTATIKIDPKTTTVPEDPRKYTISSTGEVNGKKRTVTKKFTVNWIEKNTRGGGLPTLPDKTALLVNEKMNLLGGTLKGNAYIQSIVNDAVQMGTYGSFKESTLHYSNQTTEKANEELIIDAAQMYELQKEVEIDSTGVTTDTLVEEGYLEYKEENEDLVVKKDSTTKKYTVTE